MRTGYTEAELTGLGKVKKQRIEIDQALAALQQPGNTGMEMYFMIDQRREQRREEREELERKRQEEREDRLRKEEREDRNRQEERQELERKRFEEREDKLEQQRREDKQFQLQFLAALMNSRSTDK